MAWAFLQETLLIGFLDALVELHHLFKPIFNKETHFPKPGVQIPAKNHEAPAWLPAPANPSVFPHGRKPLSCLTSLLSLQAKAVLALQQGQHHFSTRLQVFGLHAKTRTHTHTHTHRQTNSARARPRAIHRCCHCCSFRPASNSARGHGMEKMGQQEAVEPEILTPGWCHSK